MASKASSAAARLCLLASRQSSSRLPQLPRSQQVSRQGRRLGVRQFSNTTARKSNEDAGEDDAQLESEPRAEAPLKKMRALELEGMTPEYQMMMDEIAQAQGHHNADDQVRNEMRGLDKELMQMEKGISAIAEGPRQNKDSFWYDDEDPDFNTEGIDEFQEDDITSIAHGKLEETRDMRHYARLATWEMPLLAQYAKPFEVPKDNEVLRWRYTTYMGEAHQGEKKVVVQFAPDDLGLTATQTSKLIKLVGARYNPSTGVIKMSASSFEHQAQNKRYLSNLVDDLVAAAKDPKDTFEDIPLDTRHHKVVKKPRFPREWLLTKERRLELESHRVKLLLEDQEKRDKNLLVDGQKAIDGHIMKLLAQQREKEAIMLEATPSGGKRARR